MILIFTTPRKARTTDGVSVRRDALPRQVDFAEAYETQTLDCCMHDRHVERVDAHGMFDRLISPRRVIGIGFGKAVVPNGRQVSSAMVISVEADSTNQTSAE